MSFAYPGVHTELDNVLQLALYSRTTIAEFYRSRETEQDFFSNGKLYIRGLYLPEYISSTETWLKINFTYSKQMTRLYPQERCHPKKVKKLHWSNCQNTTQYVAKLFLARITKDEQIILGMKRRKTFLVQFEQN